jgi:phosphatidylserine/phosphatidylglycerophosphate/cardiolipin synthase-like enzyme
MLKSLIASALLVLWGEAAIGAPASAPLALVESRPLETSVGDSLLPATVTQWLEMIGSAKSTLDLEEYYLSEIPGQALTPVLQAIGAAAGRGVHVRLLLDSRLHRTYPQPADSLGKLTNLSVRIIDYGKRAGGVQHSKFFVVDGKEAFVGSQNLDWRSLSHIHELGLRVRMPSVASALEDVFETDWGAADTTKALVAVDRARVQWPISFEQGGEKGELWLGASPRKTTPASIPWDRDLLVRRINEAKSEIVIQSLQYAVSGFGSRDSTIHQALIAAAGRGVKVRLLISDWVLGGSGEADLRALAAVPNVEVHISRLPDWSGGYISFARVEHCKYMVADSAWLWLGTSNWEPSYFLTTRNVGLTIRHGGLARSARRVFENDWTASSSLPFGPETRLASKPHGEKPPEASKVSGK